MGDGVVWFGFPRDEVEEARCFFSKEYYEQQLVIEPGAAVRLSYRLARQVQDWQEAQKFEVTKNTPPGTEVEITDPDYRPEPLYRSWLVGPDPRFSGAVVFDELRGYLRVEWEYLRLVKLLPQEVEAYGGG